MPQPSDSERLVHELRRFQQVVSQRSPFRWLGGALLILVLLVVASASTYVVQPGTRGIRVTLGKTAPGFLSEGFGFKPPFISSIVNVNVRQQTQGVSAACFSSDLQQVDVEIRVLYRV